MAMTMNDHNSYSNSLSYSFDARNALGVKSDYYREDEEWVHTVTYNRLVARGNEADSQANIYLLTGAGVMTQSGGKDEDAALTLGIEADWESRRFFVSYENQWIKAGDMEDSLSHKTRVGVAPYIGGYNDVHTWLMLQTEYHPTQRDNVTVTPLVRVFNQELLGEFGISTKRDVMLNLTYQF